MGQLVMALLSWEVWQAATAISLRSPHELRPALAECRTDPAFAEACLL